MAGKKLCKRRPRAIEDIDTHATQFAKESVHSALKFVDKIEETVEFIMQFPVAGGRFVTQNQRLHTTWSESEIGFSVSKICRVLSCR